MVHHLVVQVATQIAESRGMSVSAFINQLWSQLPYELQEKVRISYHGAMMGGGKLSAAQTRGDKTERQYSWTLANEFLRMIVQDQDFLVEVTESVTAPTSLLEEIRELLTNLAKVIQEWLTGDKLSAEAKTSLNDFLTQLRANPLFQEAVGRSKSMLGTRDTAPTGQNVAAQQAQQAAPSTAPPSALPADSSPIGANVLQAKPVEPMSNAEGQALLRKGEEWIQKNLPPEQHAAARQALKVVALVWKMDQKALFPESSPAITDLEFAHITTQEDVASGRAKQPTIGKDATELFQSHEVGFDIKGDKIIVDLGKLAIHPRGPEAKYIKGQLWNIAPYARTSKGRTWTPEAIADSLRNGNVQDLPYLLRKAWTNSKGSPAVWKQVANSLESRFAELYPAAKSARAIAEGVFDLLKKKKTEQGKLYAGERPEEEAPRAPAVNAAQLATGPLVFCLQIVYS